MEQRQHQQQQKLLSLKKIMPVAAFCVALLPWDKKQVKTVHAQEGLLPRKTLMYIRFYVQQLRNPSKFDTPYRMEILKKCMSECEPFV